MVFNDSLQWAGLDKDVDPSRTHPSYLNTRVMNTRLKARRLLACNWVGMLTQVYHSLIRWQGAPLPASIR